MRSILSIVALALFVVFSGCSEDHSHLPQLTVDFTWPEIRAGEISPEITVKKVPPETRRLQIKMYDQDNYHNHGGDTLDYTGSGTIPEGALTKYQGPGAVFGSPRYEITIKAMDADGDIIAIGKKMRRYPPEPG